MGGCQKLRILCSKKMTKRGGGGQKLLILRRHSLLTAPKYILMGQSPFLKKHEYMWLVLQPVLYPTYMRIFITLYLNSVHCTFFLLMYIQYQSSTTKRKLRNSYSQFTYILVHKYVYLRPTQQNVYCTQTAVVGLSTDCSTCLWFLYIRVHSQ